MNLAVYLLGSKCFFFFYSVGLFLANPLADPPWAWNLESSSTQTQAKGSIPLALNMHFDYLSIAVVLNIDRTIFRHI